MTPDQKEIVKKILSVSQDSIKFIALFGSTARGENTETSDLDIAISTTLKEKKERFDFKLDIISELETVNQEVDVVIIEDSNWSLRYRIAKDGIVLFERDEDVWPNFLEKVMIYYPDYRRFEKKMLKEMLNNN